MGTREAPLAHTPADMEFIKSGTSDTYVKYLWAGVKFQELTQTNTLSVKIAEFKQKFSQNNWSEFVFE